MLAMFMAMMAAATTVQASLPSQPRTKAAAGVASGHYTSRGHRGSAATVSAAGGLGRGRCVREAEAASKIAAMATEASKPPATELHESGPAGHLPPTRPPAAGPGKGGVMLRPCGKGERSTGGRGAMERGD